MTVAPADGRDQTGRDETVLDAPVWHSLTGAHASFAQTHGSAARYHPEVSVFAAVAPGSGASGLADLASLLGPGGRAVVPFLDVEPPPGWTVELDRPGVQMLAVQLDPSAAEDAVPLGPADVPEMLDLIARTQPGPFGRRTVELGGYLGIRQGGALVAMAGQRMRPRGYTEISAVCTDPTRRGRGLASRLVRAVSAAIVARGEVPMLHAAAANEDARRLYESLGFERRRTVDFRLLRVPDA